jgi:preprotein translocase subunit SecB
MISHLQLNNYFIKEFSYRSNPAYSADAQVRNEGKISCTVELGKGLNAPDHFMVALVITVEPSTVSPALDPYHINMRIEGYFSFKPGTDAPQPEKERMVSLNGCSILMGLARGLVAQATGVSQFGRYLLPPVNFVEILKGLERGTVSSVSTADVPVMVGEEKA